MAYARPLQSPPCEISTLESQLAAALALLEPASDLIMSAELAGAYRLQISAGMSVDNMTEIIKVSRRALGKIAVGPLREACLTATRRCRFVNEVLPTIVEESEIMTKRLQSQIASLRRRIAHPPVALIPDKRSEDREITIEEICAMSPTIRSIGVRCGWIDPDIAAIAKRMNERAAGAGA